MFPVIGMQSLLYLIKSEQQFKRDRQKWTSHIEARHFFTVASVGTVLRKVDLVRHKALNEGTL
jgi:hypothetical protein